MDPKLIAIAGPLRSTVIRLTDDKFSIGRDKHNQLSINDASMSRSHCQIVRDDEGYKLEDLDSHNGTFVNDVPSKKRLLEHGDRIRIGTSAFLFVLSEAAAAQPSSEIVFDAGTLLTRSVTQLRVEDILYVMARELSALMKISQTINSIRNLETLQRQLLESVFEAVPAQRGAVLLMDADAEAPHSIFGRDRSSAGGQPVRVSRTVVGQVLREGVALLSNEVLTSEEFDEVKSLAASRIRSLLCVPLLLDTRPLGVIYLDTSEPGVCFDDGHLRLVTMIANIAAVAIENARHVEWLEGENQRLRVAVEIEHKMVGESPQMQAVYQVISRVAPTDSTVLIRGESGTGKELAARAIHENSRRAGKAFIAVNCATLTEALLESELFGHERGAFTGAIAQKKGKLEVGDGGTIFLDEVGEMAPVLQAKLLRVLQQREFERIGGTRPIKVDIRVIAATNKDLEGAIRDNTFRQDLYYRLNVVALELPPLRARQGDVQLLASYFAAKYADKCKRQIRGLSPEVRACLSNYDWPGNVRELENAMERAVVLGSAEYLMPEDLPEAVLEAAGGEMAPITKLYESVNEAKKQFILKALEQSGGNFTGAAKLLGVHPNNLHRLMRNLNLKPPGGK